jgi:hypothetical protein
MRERAMPLTVANNPPITMRPLGCTASARTLLSGPVPTLKVLSNVPSAFKRAMYGAGDPLYCVKAPPINTLPSGKAFTACTVPLAPAPSGLKSGLMLPGCAWPTIAPMHSATNDNNFNDIFSMRAKTDDQPSGCRNVGRRGAVGGTCRAQAGL